MKKLLFILVISVVAFSACTKKADTSNDWYTGVRSKADITAELSKSEYPYNQMSDIAKKEIIEAASFDANLHLNGFQKSINSVKTEIGLKGMQTLFSKLAQANLLLIDRDGNLLVKTANKTEGDITTSTGTYLVSGTTTMHVCPSKGCNPYCQDCWCVNLVSNNTNGTN